MLAASRSNSGTFPPRPPKSVIALVKQLTSVSGSRSGPIPAGPNPVIAYPRVARHRGRAAIGAGVITGRVVLLGSASTGSTS